jgi:hypothetical protein
MDYSLVDRYASEVSVKVLRTPQELEGIREAWESWPGPRDSDIDFYLMFIQSYPRVLRPHVVVLYRNGHPDAILIGRLERTRVNSQIGYLRLSGIPARTLNFVYGGLRGNASNENTSDLITSVMQSLRSREADVAFLHQPSTDSFLYKAALTQPGFWCLDRLSKPEEHHTMKLPEAADHLYQGLSKGLRGELRRKKKKLLSDFDGRVTTRCYRLQSDLEIALPHLEEVAKKTYQRGLRVGFQDTPQVRRRLEFCAQKGWLRIYVLYIDERPCSFSAGTVYNGVYTTDYIAYDPAYRDYYLGKLLLVEVIEACYKGGVKEIDFGFGQAEYKERFGNCRLTESSVYIFAPNLKGFVVNVTRTVPGVIDKTLKATLQRTRLLSNVKRFWRRHAGEHPPLLGGLRKN